MTTPPCSGADGCWTIDATSAAANGDDNGYLDNARTCVPSARAHSRTSVAAHNLAACESAGAHLTLNIVGHGKPGVIVTGAGLDFSQPDKLLSAGNEALWVRLVRPLARRGACLRLWSCHTGAGQLGVDLIYDLAQLLHCECAAPTGLVSCDPVSGFNLEDNSAWQRVSPGDARPRPIDAPGHHVFVGEADWSLPLAPNERAHLSQVSSVQASLGRSALAPLSLTEARAVLTLIDVAHPRFIEAPLGALITSVIAISFQRESGETAIKSLQIYNDRIATAVDEPSVYYDCDDGFAAALAVGFV